MLKDFINTDLNNRITCGMDIHIIKKYVVKTSFSESFLVGNFSLLLIKSGTFKIKLKEITKEVTARDLLILPIGSRCRMLKIQDNLQLYLISFNSEFFFKNGLKKELVDSLYFFMGKAPVKIALAQKEFLMLSLIYKVIYIVHQDGKENGIDVELQRISFTLFLYELGLIYEKYSQDTSGQFIRKESLILKFLTILALHCKEQHSAQFYAGALCITPCHLNKVLKQVTGQTVKKIIISAIVGEAQSLLDNPQPTIAQIAEELKFSTANNFSLFFKKHTGLSPYEYRIKVVKKAKRQ